MKFFQSYWEKKTTKEKRILLGIIIFCSFLLLWSMLIVPSDRKIDTLSADIENKTNLLFSLLHFDGPNKLTSLNKSMDLAEFQAMLKKFNTQAKIEQDTEGKYILSFSTFSFDKLMLLLEDCYTEYGLKLFSLKIQRLAQPGFVSGEVAFSL